MGFNTNTVRFLLEAKNHGVDFANCATLGQQRWRVGQSNLEWALGVTGSSALREAITVWDNRRAIPATYTEEFLKVLGAQTVQSIDISDYQGATVLHDMNQPVPSDWHERFSCLIDSGTLEHVFNFPVAIRNCMRMTKLGGHILLNTPCNNQMGHGFYQFSPELFWGVFSSKNGFTVEQMLIYEFSERASWYVVANPKDIHCRVQLQNSRQTALLVQAKKIALTNPEHITPQQSDYVAAWDLLALGSAKKTTPSSRGFFEKLETYLRRRWKTKSLPLINRFQPVFSKPSYTKYK